ncbi:MAG: carboxypeptidase-like regulatory domain-containing protein, partial [Thermoplasmatales archaeon]|nr:carboxypeptidase-like regulatory domain-containing protein [Thermoplasmatales archaeon]
APLSADDDLVGVVDKYVGTSKAGYTTSGDFVLTAADPEEFPWATLYKIPSVTFTGSSVDWSLPGGWDANGNVYGFRIYESDTEAGLLPVNPDTSNANCLPSSASVIGNVTGNTTTTFDYAPVTGNWYAISVLYRGQIGDCEDYTTVVESLYRGAPAQATDVTPPVITHTPETSASEGEPITITATITDNSGTVTGASVFYRKTGTTPYTEIAMSNPSGNTWTGTIPALAVTTDGVEYYISATDGTNTATHPATNPETSPHPITVSAAVTTGTISGTVIDSVSTDDIPGATVTAYETGTTTVANTTTAGSDGTYSMELDAGTYDVEASADGYKTNKLAGIQINVSDVTLLDIPLTPEVVDTTGPTITALLPVDSSTVSTGTPTISASYADPSGINDTSVVLKVDNVDVTSNATVTVTGVSYIPAVALSDAEHTIYLEVKDASNKSNAANTTWSFTVDTESPVITHTPVTSGTAGVKITITATITDINLTAVSVFYRVHGTENYTSWPMTYVSNDDYTFDIPASAVTTAGVEYYIWAKDGAGNEATNGTAALPHSVDVSAANQPPTLSSGGVSPGSGKTDTTFTFSVTYTDADNNAPTIKNVYIDDVAHEMSSTDTDYTDGAVFTYSTTLSKGSHTYYFEFSDEINAPVKLPISGTSSGPSVTEKASKPGFIPGIGIIGTSLAMLGAALIIYRKRRK